MKRIIPLALVLAACSTPSKSSTSLSSVPTGSATIDVIALKYAVANDVAGLLGEFTVPNPNSNAPAGFTSTRILSDPRTNSLVVQADAADLPRIRELIAKLDVQVK